MAANVTVVKALNVAARGMKFRVVKVQGDNSYPSGGYTIDPADCFLENLMFFIPLLVGGRLGEWDDGNSKLKFMQGDYSETSDGPLVEVSGDMAAVYIWGVAVGY